MNKILIVLIAFLATSFSAPPRVLKPVPLLQVTHELSNFESEKFYQHIDSRLPSYKRYFKKYSDKHLIPWTLIAAVAYQESKWNEDAVSYTGVKGLMQLTTKTAQHLGIQDREDPYQSIKGGSFYLKYLFDKTPRTINSKQRWALALAAYNIGWGHLQDARALAVKLKKNPNKWSDLKSVLPKLEQTHYHIQLNHGYARGTETVDFVNKVFGYYSLLNNAFYPKTQIADYIFAP